MRRLPTAAVALAVVALSGCGPNDTEPFASGFQEGFGARSYLGSDLHLYGGPTNDTYLGCLSCASYDPLSVHNPHGVHGSPYMPNSIFNGFGPFGSEFSMYSVCAEYATDPPVVKNGEGRILGYLTIKPFHYNRIVDPSLVALVEAACRR